MKADVTFHFDEFEYEEWTLKISDQEKALDIIETVEEKMRNYAKHQIENGYTKALLDSGFTQEQIGVAHEAMRSFIRSIKTLHAFDL
jgi:uncharacterized ubiquitin-like protein YukD